MDWHGERRYAVYENFQLNNEQVRNGESGDLLVLSLGVGHLNLHSAGQLPATGCGEIPCLPDLLVVELSIPTRTGPFS